LSHLYRRRGRLLATLVGIAAAVSAVAIPAVAGPAGATTVPAPTVPATTVPLAPPKAWILVDVDSGRVIDGGNDHTALPPASLTKVITALATKRLAPQTPVPVSDRAAASPADKMFMKAGQVWTADEMMHALLISSANDAAVALAEKVGGTLEGFGAVFAQTAASLGMVDHPVLADPAGLDGREGLAGGNLVSARDLAIAGRALLAMPELTAIASTPVYYFDGPDGVHHRLTNHNKLFLTTYAGAVGLKTGYTQRAGSCLMAAARIGGRTMLAVVLNSPNPTLQARQLLDRGFATPVAGETTADHLPAVNLASLGTSGVPAVVVTAPPPAASGTAAPTPVAQVNELSGPWASWPQPLVLAAVGTPLALGLVWMVSRRRPRRGLHQVSGGSRSAGRTRRAA
jgi:D-alanyl-D-alanine carboxypeptidase (penicillin-binding protein 5/6)